MLRRLCSGPCRVPLVSPSVFLLHTFSFSTPLEPCNDSDEVAVVKE